MNQRTLLQKIGNSYVEMIIEDGSLHPKEPIRLHKPEDLKKVTKGKCIGIGIHTQEALTRLSKFYL